MRIAIGETAKRLANGQQNRSRSCSSLARRSASPQDAVPACDVDEGLIDWAARLEDPALLVAKAVVPGRHDHRARHQQAGGVMVRLPLPSPRGRARPADGLGRRRRAEERGLRRVFHDQVPMESPVPATLVRQREAVAILLGGMLLGIQALVDKDTAVPVDRAQNGRLAARRPRARCGARADRRSQSAVGGASRSRLSIGIGGASVTRRAWANSARSCAAVPLDRVLAEVGKPLVHRSSCIGMRGRGPCVPHPLLAPGFPRAMRGHVLGTEAVGGAQQRRHLDGPLPNDGGEVGGHPPPPSPPARRDRIPGSSRSPAPCPRPARAPALARLSTGRSG